MDSLCLGFGALIFQFGGFINDLFVVCMHAEEAQLIER